jgi:hypothetical protein
MRLEDKSKGSFLWRVWLEAVLIAYVLGNLVHAVFPSNQRTDLNGMSVLGLVGLVLIVGPLFETLAFQCLPLELTARLQVRRWFRFLVSIVPFALLHHFAGVSTVVAAGVVGGFYFAFTYERWRKESTIVAVGMTFVLHSSFNLVGVLGMLLFSR